MFVCLLTIEVYFTVGPPRTGAPGTRARLIVHCGECRAAGGARALSRSAISALLSTVHRDESVDSNIYYRVK